LGGFLREVCRILFSFFRRIQQASFLCGDDGWAKYNRLEINVFINVGKTAMFCIENIGALSDKPSALSGCRLKRIFMAFFRKHLDCKTYIL